MKDISDNKIPYDMKCGNCEHIASEHWMSHNGTIYDGKCRECDRDTWKENPCRQFIFDNLNYIEKLAERKNLI